VGRGGVGDDGAGAWEKEGRTGIGPRFGVHLTTEIATSVKRWKWNHVRGSS